MNYQEKELQRLRLSVVLMMDYAKDQMQKAKKALLNEDMDLAEEVINNEARVDAFDISINRDCENYIALHQPVAGDLRLLVALMRCVTSAERIGDHANGIAKFLLNLNSNYSKQLLEELDMARIFDNAIEMLENVIDAMEDENADIARQVFRKDKFLDSKNLESAQIIADYYVKDKNEDMLSGLYLFRTIGKLERVGDLIKNIAEEIIFYLEATVLRHSKQNKSKS